MVEKIKLFLLELGVGFSFIGSQYRLSLSEKEYFIDLLFFNRKLRSLVAIDLKIGTFERIHQENELYLGLLDDTFVKQEDENPSIGLILCADKNHVEVELALRDYNKPIGVSDYRLQFPEKQIKELIYNEIKNIENEK